MNVNVNNRMKLSVYIPTLKRDALFERCMQSLRRSIAAAGHVGFADGDYEVCIVEGVSPLAAARNAGIERTTGEWIACVDADDEVTEDWFGEICRAIGQAESNGEPIDDIFFDMMVITPNRSWLAAYNGPSLVDGSVLCRDVLRDMRIESHTWRHVVRRTVFEGLRYELVRVFEDYVTTPRFLRRVRQALYVQKPLYRYMIREGSLATSCDRDERLEIVRARLREWGHPSEVSLCRICYEWLYDREGDLRRWRAEIRRHLPQLLFDGGIPLKWRLKFLLAACGLIVRHLK